MLILAMQNAIVDEYFGKRIPGYQPYFTLIDYNHFNTVIQPSYRLPPTSIT